MGWKCTPQVKGLVRGTPSKSAKHRANIRAIIAEMGEERISKSDTLDRSRSHLNVYSGYTSGFQCADVMTRQADYYRIKCTGKGGAKVERKLRNDAVIGCSVIFNPPEEVCRNWTDAQYKKFYKDSADALEKICPAIFRSENIRMTAEHYDEGTIADPGAISRHIHQVYDCIDTEGKYCGNLIDGKTLDNINRVYPAFMRSRGWDIDDLDCTDWDRAKDDEAYKEIRIKKRKKSGKDVNDYLTDKLRDQIQQNDSLSNQLTGMIQHVAVLEADNEEQLENNVKRGRDLVRDCEELNKYQAELLKVSQTLNAKENRLDTREAALNDRERVLREKEEEIARRDKESLKKANTLSDATDEIIAKYREAQQFYLQEQTWSGAEARKHIQERNREATRRIRQAETLQKSVKNYSHQDGDDYQF